MKSPTLLSKCVELVCEALLQTFIALALFFAMFLAFLSFIQTAHANPRYGVNAHRLTIHLQRDADGAKASMSCSSTAVGARTILTATHCFEVPTGVRITALEVDGKPVVVEKHETDGLDHSLVVLKSRAFDKFALLSQKSPTLYPGLTVSWTGWPSGFGRMYRRGYVAGRETSTAPGVEAWLLDANGGVGDSGSGVFDEKGRLVGVVSYVNQGKDRDGLRGPAFVGVFVWKFTAEQVGVVK